MRALFFLPVALCMATSAAAQTQVKNRRVEPGQTLAHVLHALPLPNDQVDGVLKALAAAGLDFTKLKVGDQLRAVLRHGELDYFDFRRDRQSAWLVRRDGDRYVGSRREVEVEQRVTTVELTVTSSLWNAAVSAGESPSIALALADVFAWDIDFNQDVRPGDRMRAVVEKRLVKGRLLDYGQVLAAEYAGSSVGTRRVFRYESKDGQVSYFQQDGSSARKSFLKSPLKFAHVTSRFGARFHPVLKYMKDHNGVDYAAAVGTPVWAPADGTVTRASYDPANGNLVCLKHQNGFETCYAHLSKVHVRAGQRVSQKQVIALTGNTGRSTGPHLHYALKRNGGFVNPLNQNFPRADPVTRAELPRFAESIVPLAEQLDATPVAALTGTGG
jgi:murein DD-endopeptidase MepM/ murein hydrolase activator NlpD